MFTGIVEEIGTIRSIAPYGDGLNFEIAAKKVLKDLSVDNSICVNGVCLTVVKRTKSSFMIQAVKETLSKTNLSLLTKGKTVNLERSVTLNDRLGGHLVQGHVDTVGEVKKVTVLETSWMYHISFPERYRKYLIPVGSITVDGTSLTVARLGRKELQIAIIPFTHSHTIFHSYVKGTKVNLEFDIIGKYLESLVHYKK